MKPNELNSLLLFGDYGPEVLKLSQVYDPTRSRYILRKAGKDSYKSSSRYYTASPEVGKKLEFTEVDEVLQTGGILSEDYWELNEEFSDENGTYVPAEKALVIVDEPADTWGTYTLLVVDRVDPYTYQSHLVPINFSGGVDSATRAIDYNNDTMTIYVENVTVNGVTSQRLVPDRRLMMYGRYPMTYVIKKTIDNISTVISTSAVTAQHKDKGEKIIYVSAAAMPVKLTGMDDFNALKAKVVSYYDATGTRREFTVTEGDTAQYNLLKSAQSRGSEILVEPDSSNPLSHVFIPHPCYLRNGVTSLTVGETVEFMAYETIDQTVGGTTTTVDRLVFASRCVIASGVSADVSDVREAVITGFGVKLNDEELGDIWSVTSSTGSESLNTTPYLKYSDGSVTTIDKNGGCYFEYGLQRLKTERTVGAEFDIVFKYFPNLATGVVSNSSLDGRYYKVNLTETTPGTVDQTPSPIRQYFTKNADNEFELANGDGHPEIFTSGVEYFTRTEKLAWQASVAHPNREVLVCRKRIRIVGTTSTSVRKICPIPIWDKTNEKWSFKFLVYTEEWTSPKLLTSEQGDYGSVILLNDFETRLAALPKFTSDTYDNETYIATMCYVDRFGNKKDNMVRTFAMMLQHFSRYSGALKYLFSFNTIDGKQLNGAYADKMHVFGLQTGDKTYRRPYIDCDLSGATPVFSISKADFPVVDRIDGDPDNYFLKSFFESYLCTLDGNTNDSWVGDVRLQPTHFIVRSAINTDVMTRPMKITSTDPTDSAYYSPFVCPGLETPTDTENAIVIVEFLAKTGDGFSSLFGVPVEVRKK